MLTDPLRTWAPPETWHQITTLDTHTAGEPLRIITSGYPVLLGHSILARREDVKTKWDHLRKALMWEPRGHREMYGCILTPPVTGKAAFGVLFLHNEGYSTMCGHAIIALAKVAVRTGLVHAKAPLTQLSIDTPAGLVHAQVAYDGSDVSHVSFANVPSFVAALDETIDVEGLGSVRYDLAFGGAYYAYLDAVDFGLRCIPEEHDQLISLGRRIKAAFEAQKTIQHPFEADLGYLYGCIFIAPALTHGVHSRNVCVFADGQIDRSPTGTGVSGRVALHVAKEELALGETIVVESILGTTFTGTAQSYVTFGPYDAVIPVIGGDAFITGRHTFFIDPKDPLQHGFMLA